MSNQVSNNGEKTVYFQKAASDGSKTTIESRVDLIHYEDGNTHYVYSPALDLIGYGKTAEEALKSWEVVIEEYVRYVVENNTLLNDLESRGWNIKKRKKEFEPPTFSWLLRNNDQVSEIFDKHNFHKTSRAIILPLQKSLI